jgi:hypothetical protein
MQKSEALCRMRWHDNDEFDRKQRAAQGFAWMATLSECLKATAKWAGERHGAGQLNRLSECAIVVGFSEYLGSQSAGCPWGRTKSFDLRNLGRRMPPRTSRASIAQ